MSPCQLMTDFICCSLENDLMQLTALQSSSNQYRTYTRVGDLFTLLFAITNYSHQLKPTSPQDCAHSSLLTY